MRHRLALERNGRGVGVRGVGVQRDGEQQHEERNDADDADDDRADPPRHDGPVGVRRSDLPPALEDHLRTLPERSRRDPGRPAGL